MPFVTGETPAGVTPIQTAGTENPTFAWPFAIGRYGASVVAQNGVPDIQGCVTRVLVCPEQYRDDLPEFGSPDLEFNVVPLPVGELQEAVEFWEPRANLQVVEEALNESPGERVVTVEVSN